MSHLLIPVELLSQWFLLDAARVREIIGEIPWLVIPHGRPEAPGVVAWQGRAVALVDLAAVALGAPPLAAGERRRRTVIAEAHGSAVALPCDAAREVVELGDEALRPPHAHPASCASAEAEVNGKVMALLDLDQLVARIVQWAPDVEGEP